MELGWSGVGAGGNGQTLAERMESIGDNCNSRHENDMTFLGLCSHPTDLTEVHLLCQKHRCKTGSALQPFPSLILKIISSYSCLSVRLYIFCLCGFAQQFIIHFHLPYPDPFLPSESGEGKPCIYLLKPPGLISCRHWVRCKDATVSWWSV